ncbi:MAG: murein transglycosylase domain-containing protein [Chitinispirillaceae bacterium]
MKNKKYLIVTVLLPLVLWAGDFSEYRKRQEDEFNEYRERQSEGRREYEKERRKQIVSSRQKYRKWKRQQELKYQAFRDEICRKWGKYTAPGTKCWVEYSNDRESFSEVNFDKGTVTVQVLKKRGESEGETKRKLTGAVKRVLSSRGSSGFLPVEAQKPELRVLKKPLLQDQVVLQGGKRATADDAQEIVDGKGGEVSKKTEPVKEDGDQKVSLTFPLAPDHIQSRMKPYLPLVRKYSKHYDLEPELVLAIIHTESSFNPMARSGANALGLMQLVADKGGADAFSVVFGRSELPSEKELLNPKLNIRLGCAYLNRLNTVYFRGVNGRDRKRYCSIAGYNTGPGNVAYAFTGSNVVKNSFEVINRKESGEVYRHLLRRLPYRETRGYLKVVVERIKLYRG